MTFSSVTFLFLFFPVTFLLYALIRNHTARNFILAAASLVFYAFGEPVAVMIMLLVEETIGMMNAMVEDYRGEMWLSYEDRTCRINLEVTAPIDKETERQLLTVSTSGRSSQTTKPGMSWKSPSLRGWQTM